MEYGGIGHLGQNVERNAKNQDSENVIILPQKMVEILAKVPIKKQLNVLEETVLLMESGKHGLHGPPAKVIVRSQDPEDAIILHLQMEERIAQVQDKR